MPEGVLPDFPNYLRKEVDRLSIYDNTLKRDEAFPVWCFHNLFDLDPDEAYNKCATRKTGDGGVDGWHYSEQDQALYIMQAKWSDSCEGRTYNAKELESLTNAVAVLQGDRAKLEKNADRNKLLELAGVYDRAVENGFAVNLIFATAGVITEMAKDRLTAVAERLKCTATFLDLPQLSEKYIDEHQISDLRGESVTFTTYSASSISSLTFPLSAEKIRAAIATLDGKAFGDAIAPCKSAIYHSNVRYHLGKSNSVNKKIHDTVSATEKRSSFWLFNNGITVVCDELTVEEKKGKILAANPQIVNGAQTSSTVAAARALLQSGDLALQAKFIEVPPSLPDAKELVRAISEFTNRQTPVKNSDLRSNEPRHRKIQKAFESLDPAWFYERRRGEWQALEPAERKEKYGAKADARYVRKEDVGQRWRAFAGEPARAIAKKDDMFDGDVNEANVFDPLRSAEQYLLAYEVFAEALNLMQTANAPRLKKLVPTWWDKTNETAELSAIRKAPRLSAAYATALVHHVLKWRYNEIGPKRAALLRKRLVAKKSFEPIWRWVFQSLRQWSSNIAEPASIRAHLQNDATYREIEKILCDRLTDQEDDKEKNLPSI